MGITRIGIFNGAFGEASLFARLTPQIASIPALAEFARENALGFVVAGITFASIVLGELVPKRIAMQYPETAATMIAAPMQWLSRIVSPFVKVLSVATDAIIRLLGLRQPKDNSALVSNLALLELRMDNKENQGAGPAAYKLFGTPSAV